MVEARPPDPAPPEGVLSCIAPPPPDSADLDARRSGKETDERDEAERQQSELNELRTKNAKLAAQIDELKSLASSPPEAPKDIQRLHLLHVQWVRDILVILLIVGLFWLGYVLRPVTIPLLIALGLAYLVEPVVHRLTRRGWLGRPGAALAVILLVVAAIVVPLGIGGAFAVAQGMQYGQRFSTQLGTLRHSIENPSDESLATDVKRQGRLWGMTRDFIVKARHPSPEPAAPAATAPTATGGTGAPATASAAPPAGSTAPTGAPEVLAADIKTDKDGQVKPPLSPAAARAEPDGPFGAQVVAWLDDLVQRSGASLGDMFGKQVLGTGGDVVRFAGRVILGSVWFAFSIFLVLVFFFFFSTQWDRVTSQLSELIPKWKRDRTLNMLRQMDAVISGFVRGRLTIMLILMAAFTVGYWLIGVPAPLLVGPFVGFLAIIPYASLVSIPLCWALMWVQPGGLAEFEHTTWWILLAPTLLYCAVQFTDDYILNPIIQGKHTNMDTPTILFAVLAGGVLLGFYGMLLAVPIAACLKIVFKDSFWPRFKAWGEGRVKDFLPISRYDPTETGAVAAATDRPAEPRPQPTAK
jgi:predicted PurR-regulated permease PerM